MKIFGVVYFADEHFFPIGVDAKTFGRLHVERKHHVLFDKFNDYIVYDQLYVEQYFGYDILNVAGGHWLLLLLLLSLFFQQRVVRGGILIAKTGVTRGIEGLRRGRVLIFQFGHKLERVYSYHDRLGRDSGPWYVDSQFVDET